ncbi:hypothetical protein DRQ33_02215 [bacterium]|nr:MAG: hypothetical protein DRQ33_02215 [bacterium]
MNNYEKLFIAQNLSEGAKKVLMRKKNHRAINKIQMFVPEVVESRLKVIKSFAVKVLGRIQYIANYAKYCKGE